MKLNLGKMFPASKAARPLLNKKGFTLTEVIVTLVIVLIAAVIAVPNVVGFVNSHKRQNCTAQLESLLSEIESRCASNRFLTEDAVSANIIASAAEFDTSVKDMVSSNHGLMLYDFCDDKNDVRLSWNIEKKTGVFDVVVKAECQDGIKGENSFSCGLREKTEYSDKASLINSLVSKIINSESVKSAYKNADVNSLAAEVSEASKIYISEFDKAKEYAENLSDLNNNVQMNTALSMFLTVVVNKNDSYANAFTSNFMGKDYMPVVVFTGILKNDIYGSNSSKFSDNAFMLFGCRDMELDDYFSPDRIFKNGDIVEFNINCVWSQDLKNIYFLSDYESSGSPTYKKASDAKANYLTSSEWTKKIM